MRPSRSSLATIFVLAFFLRFAWILGVQHPLDAVYSDMAGYVERAEQLLWNLPSADPRTLAIYPWGAHALFAAEFAIVGRHAVVPIAVVHALLGAIPAPCAAILAARIVASRQLAVAAGLLVAIWSPQIAFAGFFLSEPWYAAAIALQAVWTSGSGSGALKRLSLGTISGIAFVVRPQFVVTWAADLVRCGWSFTRRMGLARATAGLALIVLPMALLIGGSALRLHALSGHWGLISENAEMTRIWADTDVCELRAHWSLPDGAQLGYWFNPPSKPVRQPSDIEEFDGFIADPVILRQIRLKRLAGVSSVERFGRRLHNVALLFTGNRPWPESNYTDPQWRLVLQEIFAALLLYLVIPLALVGCVLGRRSAALFICALNVATCVVCAAFFFGEGRYHVPYDPFFVVLALVGAYEVARRAGATLARRRIRRRAMEG